MTFREFFRLLGYVRPLLRAAARDDDAAIRRTVTRRRAAAVVLAVLLTELLGFAMGMA